MTLAELKKAVIAELERMDEAAFEGVLRELNANTAQTLEEVQGVLAKVLGKAH